MYFFRCCCATHCDKVGLRANVPLKAERPEFNVDLLDAPAHRKTIPRTAERAAGTHNEVVDQALEQSSLSLPDASADMDTRRKAKSKLKVHAQLGKMELSEDDHGAGNWARRTAGAASVVVHGLEERRLSEAMLSDAARDRERTPSTASRRSRRHPAASLSNLEPRAEEDDPLATALAAGARVRELLRGVSDLTPPEWKNSETMGSSCSKIPFQRKSQNGGDACSQSESSVPITQNAVADEAVLALDGQVSEITQIASRGSFSSASDFREARIRRERYSHRAANRVSVGRPLDCMANDLELDDSSKEEEPETEIPGRPRVRLSDNSNSQKLSAGESTKSKPDFSLRSQHNSRNETESVMW